MIAHGANNIYENGENLLTGRSDSEGWVRKGYQAVAKSMGGSMRDGNIAYGVSDIGLSVYGMTRMVLRTGAWKLFKYIPSDYVRSYINMSRGAIVFEVGVDMLTGEQVYVETKNDPVAVYWCFADSCDSGLLPKIPAFRPQLGYLKSFACLAFNLFFVTYHLRWFKREYLLFVGYTPDLFNEHLSLQWLILGCLILHCFANPVGWKLRRWYSPW